VSIGTFPHVSVENGGALWLPAIRGAGSSTAEDDAFKAAVEELFRRCERGLGRYLAQFVRDRALAEDLLQDSFHAALLSRAQLPGVENREAWLYGIARNRALNALRRRRRFDGALARLGRWQRSGSQDDSELVALRDLLDQTLSPEDRSLVLLRYLHDFDAVELGEMTGLTPDAVRQRLSRARARLLAAHPDTEGDPR
jgi:RNA polymerase sigma-70 factor (ECF subfamily)